LNARLVTQLAAWAKDFFGHTSRVLAIFAVKSFLPQSARRTAAKVTKPAPACPLKLTHYQLSG
ncbi:MAG: hypothetical protein WA252_02360, partial [Candidatus Sulfotelmatobacter sp.]